MSTIEQYAVGYAERGLRVFPARGKVPLLAHGCKDASSDPDVVRRMWGQHPGANVAIATGNGYAVLDVDGAVGAASLTRLEAEHGALVTSASQTWAGIHLWFRVPSDVVIGNSAGRVGKGLDVRGEGGYVLAPPSMHPSGVCYRWESRVPLDVMPGWLVELARKREPERLVSPVTRRLEPGQDGTRYGLAALARETDAVRLAVEGTRNHQLNEAAFALGQLVGGGELAQSIVEEELAAAAHAAGLGAIETERTIRSGLRAGAEYPRGAVA